MHPLKPRADASSDSSFTGEAKPLQIYLPAPRYKTLVIIDYVNEKTRNISGIRNSTEVFEALKLFCVECNISIELAVLSLIFEDRFQDIPLRSLLSATWFDEFVTEVRIGIAMEEGALHRRDVMQETREGILKRRSQSLAGGLNQYKSWLQSEHNVRVETENDLFHFQCSEQELVTDLRRMEETMYSKDRHVESLSHELASTIALLNLEHDKASKCRTDKLLTSDIQHLRAALLESKSREVALVERLAEVEKQCGRLRLENNIQRRNQVDCNFLWQRLAFSERMCQELTELPPACYCGPVGECDLEIAPISDCYFGDSDISVDRLGLAEEFSTLDMAAGDPMKTRQVINAPEYRPSKKHKVATEVADSTGCLFPPDSEMKSMTPVSISEGSSFGNFYTSDPLLMDVFRTVIDG